MPPSLKTGEGAEGYFESKMVGRNGHSSLIAWPLSDTMSPAAEAVISGRLAGTDRTFDKE
ncbi:MAG TPA: hypothetical protein VNN25_08150 [Thermoanaerobaculia bacterium]|nr:hypothetical protein [Thermoanaerobaculia bacterium]